MTIKKKLNLLLGTLLLCLQTNLHAQEHFTLLVWLKPDCPVCQKIAPALQETLAKHQNIKAQLIFVNCKKQAAKSFAKQHELHTQTLKLDRNHHLATTHQVKVSPDFLLFDPQMNLIYRGPLNDAIPQLGLFLPPTINHVSEAIENQEKGIKQTIIKTPIGCVFR